MWYGWSKTMTGRRKESKENQSKSQQKGRDNMASIRKRGENSYLIVVSRGYDYEGNRLKSAQKTGHPPLELKPK